MKKISRLTAVLVVCILALICLLIYLCTCLDGKTDERNLSLKEYQVTEEYVKTLGRTYFDEQGLLLSYSGSGFEFYCEGTYATVTLTPTGSYLKGNEPRYALTVNGEIIYDEILQEEKTLTLTFSEESSVVRLIKLSEGMFSSFYVSEISAFSKGDIEPTEKSSISIEFIGDSITCGYGIDAGANGKFSTATENFMKTYAYITAENMNADYSVLSYSGYGVYSGYTEKGVRNPAVILPEYEKAYYGDENLSWSFEENIADIVVINLGTNDASYCSGSSYLRGQFISSYTELLSAVREKNPNAYILCILGDMNNSMFSSIENAVTDYQNQTGDGKVFSFIIDFKMGENEIVIDGHPGAQSNKIAAENLTAKIKEIIGGTF